jgi:hypothetical protein
MLLRELTANLLLGGLKNVEKCMRFWQEKKFARIRNRESLKAIRESRKQYR